MFRKNRNEEMLLRFWPILRNIPKTKLLLESI